MTAYRYLLLPGPGLDPELLDELLSSLALKRVIDSGRGYSQPRLLRWATAPGSALSTVEYQEDHTLGQRQIYASGPRSHELAQACAARFPCRSPEQALDLAERAVTPVDKVATLAPLVVLISERAVPKERAHAVIAARLIDAVAAVKRAALLVAANVRGEDGAALLRRVVSDPQLAAEAQRQLAARTRADQAADEPTDPAALTMRAEAALSAGDAAWARRLLDRALADDALASGAYLLRARANLADQKIWPAFIDVSTALAVARRQGLRLQGMHQLQLELRGKLATPPVSPTVADELHAVASLATLLHLGRLHEVEEVATALLPLPGRPAIWWLAIALTRRERGRSERAIEALEAALLSQPRLLAARFVLGECRRDQGDAEGALREFARLDPVVSAERPPPPSLLDAYADELLGAQAPWESREHAFVKIRLLRECARPTEALAVTTALLAREPPAADALLAHAILLRELHRPAEAVTALDRARAALRPEERLLSDEDPLADIELQRAAALAALGDKDAAAAALHTALRLSPECANTLDQALLALVPSVPSPSGHAALRRIAQRSLLQENLGADTAPDPPDAPDAVEQPDLEDPEVGPAALRGQVADLLVLALALLDEDAEPAARRAGLERAWRELAALKQLAPRLLATQQKSLRAIFAATAQALGLADAADPLPSLD